MKIKRWQLVLIIALLIVFAAVCIYAAIEMFTGGVQIGKKGTYENGWSKDIVTKIVDGDVPVPDGFEYVSGTKSTGVIIKNKNTGALYIWIPTSLENGEIEDYENKVSSIFGELTETLSSDLLENISTYGGFYVGISGEGIVDIAGMTEEEYILAREKANELYGDSKSVSSVLIDSEMLASISWSWYPKYKLICTKDVTSNKKTWFGNLPGSYIIPKGTEITTPGPIAGNSEVEVKYIDKNGKELFRYISTKTYWEIYNAQETKPTLQQSTKNVTIGETKITNNEIQIYRNEGVKPGDRAPTFTEQANKKIPAKTKITVKDTWGLTNSSISYIKVSFDGDSKYGLTEGIWIEYGDYNKGDSGWEDKALKDYYIQGTGFITVWEGWPKQNQTSIKAGTKVYVTREGIGTNNGYYKILVNDKNSDKNGRELYIESIHVEERSSNWIDRSLNNYYVQGTEFITAWEGWPKQNQTSIKAGTRVNITVEGTGTNNGYYKIKVNDKNSDKNGKELYIESGNVGPNKPTPAPEIPPTGNEITTGSQNTTGDKNPTENEITTGNQNTTIPVEQPKVADPEEGYTEDKSGRKIYIVKDIEEVWYHGNKEKDKKTPEDTYNGYEFTMQGYTANWIKTTNTMNPNAGEDWYLWLPKDSVSETKPYPEEGYTKDDSGRKIYITKNIEKVWQNGKEITEKWTLEDTIDAPFTVLGYTQNWVKTTNTAANIDTDLGYLWLPRNCVSEIKPDNRSNLEKLLTNSGDLVWNGDNLVIKTPKQTIKENGLKEVKNTYGDYIDTVLEDKNGNKIPIPQGFSYYSGKTAKEGISVVYNSSKVEGQVSNQLGVTYRLRYIWIPVDDITKTAEVLTELYNKGKSKQEQVSVDYYEKKLDTEKLDENLVESIKKYGGFYMSEAEVGFDDEGNLYNRYRGMNKVNSGNYFVNIGDYFRTKDKKGLEDRSKIVYPNWLNERIQKELGYKAFSGTKQTLTYDVAKLISDEMFLSKPVDENGKEITIESEKDKRNKSAVISHLTYGAEWNAAMIWLCDTNNKDLILKDSSNVGKYKGNLLSDPAKISLNGLWGLGGNLAELTQEKNEKNQVVLRGGSYADLGNTMPISGRRYLEESTSKEIAKDDVGFRNCLYIKVGSEHEEQKEGKANAPVLGKGMTAVKWNGSKWETVANPDKDTSWYSYDGEGDNKTWANAQTKDGSMWVWIPRYEYKINKDQTIDINFISGNSNANTEGYIIHPAFTSNVHEGGWDKEIPGIWVAKYEASGNKEEGKISFRAGEEILTHNVSISEANTLSREYNQTLNSHLMKNSEWGAVAYLTQSIYGRDTEEIKINSSTKTGKPNESASTTGNVYGIYDMSGGTYEYVACYYRYGNMVKKNSLYTENNNSTKYVTVYERNDAAIMGDATYETMNWNSDFGQNELFNQANMFMIRGGSYLTGSGHSGIFAYALRSGEGDSVCGFRTTLIIDENGTAVPSKVSNVKVSSIGKKVTIDYDSVSDVDGYEISCVTSDKSMVFSSEKNKYETSEIPYDCGIYKVKVRAYRNVNGGKIYGQYSDEILFIDNVKEISVQSYSNGRVDITWERINGIDNYEIILNGNSSTINTKGNTHTRAGAKKGENTLIIRGFQRINGKIIYGEELSTKFTVD